MPFPDTKTVEKSFFGVVYSKKVFNLEWEDLGEASGYWDADSKRNLYPSHQLCGTILNVGKEETGELFRFCPRCFRKVVEK